MDTVYKNVVIVGAISGYWPVYLLRNKLPKDYRIILIDRQEELFYPIAALRAAVVPGWEDRVHTSFANIFGKDDRHIALPGTTVLELKERSIMVDKEYLEVGLGLEIPFEYCILATGASQSIPARAPGTTEEEIVNYLRQAQRAIASSRNVLVVGGGPAGLEFATEVRELHPNVGVTLVQRSDRLSRGAPGVHEKVLPVLREMGIEVILEDTIDWPEGYVPGDPVAGKTVFRTHKGRTIEAQYVYDATGNKPNSQLVLAVDPAAVSKNGCVRVKLTFEIDSKNPALGRYFAMGDVADVPEIKLLGGSLRHGRIVSANLLSRIAGKPATRHHTPRPTASNITLGTRNAVFYTPWFTIAGWFPSLFQPKDLHTSHWLHMYGAKGHTALGHAKGPMMALTLVFGFCTWFVVRWFRK